MAYNGYLIKIGDYIIPSDKYIGAGTYSPYANMQVLDPYTDGNGYEHIEAVELKALKVEFQTPAGLTNTEYADLMSHIRANYIEANSRKCIVTAYIPEYDDYFTQVAYLADPKPVVNREEPEENVLYYNAIRMSFIGGVYGD